MDDRIIGEKFGLLTIESLKFDKRTVAVCKCLCGRTIEAALYNVKRGNTTSCGCKRMGDGNGNFRHGKSDSRLHKIWENMKYRCNNPNYTNFQNYGGRGITVCEEWANDFSAFYKWAIENGYKDTLTIDRVDNEKGYSPNNCRWATPKAQVGNRRNTIRVEYKNKLYTLSELASMLNENYNKIYHLYRVNRLHLYLER